MGGNLREPFNEPACEGSSADDSLYTDSASPVKRTSMGATAAALRLIDSFPAELFLDQAPQDAEPEQTEELARSDSLKTDSRSKSARLVRIMAEFIETQDILRSHRIMGTIMFFGSARLLSEESWNKEYAAISTILASSDVPEDKKTALNNRVKQLERFRHNAVLVTRLERLAQLLTAWFSTIEARQCFVRISQSLPHTTRTVLDAGKAQGHISKRDIESMMDLQLPSPVVVCTGGGPGVMEAVNRGASKVKNGRTMGMGVTLPFEGRLNKYITSGLDLTYHYFFTRKFWMCYFALGVVIGPGGFGSIDEAMELLTLRQSGKMKRKIPIVFFGEKFWNTAINFPFLVEEGVIAQEDVDSILFTDDEVVAFEHVTRSLLAQQ